MVGEEEGKNLREIKFGQLKLKATLESKETEIYTLQESLWDQPKSTLQHRKEKSILLVV